jgi:hypothetical protein
MTAYRCALVLTLLLGVPSATWAQLDCVVPTDESTSGSGLALGSPALAPIRRAALAADAVVKRNARFVNGARPVRVRTKIQYSHAAPWTASVFIGVYNREAWVGRCGISPFADRGGGLRDGSVLITINEPRAFLGYPVGGDAELEAFEAPPLVGRVAGFAEYKDATGTALLLSSTVAAPWTAVTIADAIGVAERRLRERQSAWEREKQRPWMTESKVQQCYQTMKAVDAARADETCAPVRKARQDEQHERPAREAAGDARFTAERQALRAYRASFSAQELRHAARPNGMPPGAGFRADDPTSPALVTVDPAFRRLDPLRVHVIYVARVVGTPADSVPGRYQWMVQSLEAIDYAALGALLD